ncbi:alpha/beta hydrolase [Deinococcus saxicola]
MVLKGGHCSRDTRLSHEKLAGVGFCVLTPSRPGYDATPADLGETAPEAARTLAALLDQLNISRVSVIGISAAGPTALAFAALFPDRVGKLVLESAQAWPWTPGTQRLARLGFGEAQALTWAMARMLLQLAPRATLRLMLSQLSSLPIQQVMAELTPADQRFVEDMIRSQNSGQGGFMNDIQHILPDLQAVTAPTLVMFSPNDRAVSPKQARFLLAGLPNAETAEVQSTSHLLWIGPQAQQVWERRLAFLRS